MGDEVEGVVENGTKSSISLTFEIANGIRHTVATLDETNSGEVSKSQLQAVVANVCRAIKTPFITDDLENYLPEKENLTVNEFLDFLETKLLVKGQKLNQKGMDEMSWVVVGQKYEDNPHLLTKKDAFKLWLAFKKLDIGGELKVDVEELCIVLEKFVRGIGVQWNEEILNEYAEDGAVSFWKFIDCLERKFLIGVDKNVLREGLQDLYDSILDEVTKTGFLYKKGHSMLKSQKSRWFVLKPDHIAYYVSSGYREKKGEIVLNNDAKVSSIPDKGSNKCRFLVTCGQTKKDYEQTAPDQRTKQAWITAIQTAIDCYGGDTPFKRGLIERKAKRDADKARKAEEERRRQEQEDLLNQQRMEIELLKRRKEEIERFADEEKAMLDAEIRRREELEELQRNLQQLLDDQKKAREEEEKVRAAKERLLEEERKKREELEALRLSQQQELQEEKIQKEELMERQKEQERVLEEERKRLQHLEEERMKAEEAAKAAHDKLSAAETAAKNAAEQAKDRVRQLKTSIGLKGTVGPKVDPLVTHRGKGAFTLEEFLNRATEWSGLPVDDEDKGKPGPQQPKVGHPDELVKACATPASNQNIPEFLKKAAAWSGLNPETYLEIPEQGKAAVVPPKVAAKPVKPVRNEVSVDDNVNAVNGAVGDGEGLQVEEGKDVEGVEDVASVTGGEDRGKDEPNQEVVKVEGTQEEKEVVDDERPPQEKRIDEGHLENEVKGGETDAASTEELQQEVKEVAENSEGPQEDVRDVAASSEKPQEKVREVAGNSEGPQDNVKDVAVSSEEPQEKVREVAGNSEEPQENVKEDEVRKVAGNSEEPQKEVREVTGNSEGLQEDVKEAAGSSEEGQEEVTDVAGNSEETLEELNKDGLSRDEGDNIQRSKVDESSNVVEEKVEKPEMEDVKKSEPEVRKVEVKESQLNDGDTRVSEDDGASKVDKVKDGELSVDDGNDEESKAGKEQMGESSGDKDGGSQMDQPTDEAYEVCEAKDDVKKSGTLKSEVKDEPNVVVGEGERSTVSKEDNVGSTDDTVSNKCSGENEDKNETVENEQPCHSNETGAAETKHPSEEKGEAVPGEEPGKELSSVQSTPGESTDSENSKSQIKEKVDDVEEKQGEGTE